MPSPTVSVILVSYNQAEYLRHAVESVLGQTFEDFELIVIDNGSTDGSPAILADYRDNPRIRLMLFEEHGNMGVRFNQGIAASKGEFVSFLYSDDYYLPHKLERQVGLFRKLPADYGVVYAAAQRVNVTTGRTWVEPMLARSGDVFADFMLGHGSIEMISPLTRRACYLERPFDEQVFFESEQIFYRIALSHRFSYMPDPVTVARDHGRNGGKAFKRNLEMSLECLANLRRDPAIRDDQRSLVDRHEVWLLRRYGWIGARLSLDPSWSRRCFVAAIRRSPRQILHPKTLAGLGLISLPASARARINALAHRLRRSPRPETYIEDYEGLAAANVVAPARPS